MRIKKNPGETIRRHKKRATRRFLQDMPYVVIAINPETQAIIAVGLDRETLAQDLATREITSFEMFDHFLVK